jgi:hypothetical protein
MLVSKIGVGLEQTGYGGKHRARMIVHRLPQRIVDRVVGLTLRLAEDIDAEDGVDAGLVYVSADMRKAVVFSRAGEIDPILERVLDKVGVKLRKSDGWPR